MTLLAAEDKSVLNVLPVGMQNSALVLKDDDGNSITTELEELSNSSEPNLVPAAINVENSTDVIIGPVTQFIGPVTIYQNVTGTPASVENVCAQNYTNGKLVKSESNASDTQHPTENPAKKICRSKRFFIVIVSALLIGLVIIIVSTTLLLVKSKPPMKPPSSDSREGEGPGDDVVLPEGPGHIIEKNVWGGNPPLSTIPLPHPTKLVIISHTVTPQCFDFAKCSQRLKNIQSFHFNRENSDIGYNFIIGTDGNAYVGRGWDVKNFHGIDSIGICFVGDYTIKHLTPDMIDMTKKLLEIGVEMGKLDKNYKLIGHNQTFATLSPGRFVYEVIKTWPHFDPSSYL